MSSPLDMLTERQRRCVPDVTFELIPISNLVSNQEYQRAISETHIRKTVEEFDVNQINPVKVSRRNGKLYVVNGQHTVEIVANESGSRSTPVWCMVFDDMDYDEEAHNFATQQRHVRQLTAYEVFKAHIEAGDAKQLLLKSIAESNGLIISGKKLTQNYVTAIGTIENIYDKFGQEVLNRTLRLAVGTWEGRAGSLSGTILTAISKIVAAYDDALEDEFFIEGVSELSAKTILRDAKDKRPGPIGVCFVMIEQYNKKARKNKLDKNGLFGGRKLVKERMVVKRQHSAQSAQPTQAAQPTQPTHVTQPTEPAQANESEQVNRAVEAETIPNFQLDATAVEPPESGNEGQEAATHNAVADSAESTPLKDMTEAYQQMEEYQE